VGFIVLQYVEIGIHAAQKSSLLFLAGFLLFYQRILFFYSGIKITLGSIGNVNAIWFDDGQLAIHQI